MAEAEIDETALLRQRLGEMGSAAEAAAEAAEERAVAEELAAERAEAAATARVRAAAAARRAELSREEEAVAAEGAARAAKAALVNTPLAALRVAQLPVAPQLGDRWRSMAAAHKELRNDISESKRLHALVSGLEANGATRTAREADWCTQETQRLRDQLSAQSRVFIDAGADEAEQAAVERAAADDAISRAEIATSG